MEDETEKPLKVLKISLKEKKRRLVLEKSDSESDGGGKGFVLRPKSPPGKKEANFDGRRSKGPVFDKKRSREGDALKTMKKGKKLRSQAEEDVIDVKELRGIIKERIAMKQEMALRVQGKGGVLKILPKANGAQSVPEKTYSRRGASEVRRNTVHSSNVLGVDDIEHSKSQEKRGLPDQDVLRRKSSNVLSGDDLEHSKCQVKRGISDQDGLRRNPARSSHVLSGDDLGHSKSKEKRGISDQDGLRRKLVRSSNVLGGDEIEHHKSKEKRGLSDQDVLRRNPVRSLNVLSGDDLEHSKSKEKRGISDQNGLRRKSVLSSNVLSRDESEHHKSKEKRGLSDQDVLRRNPARSSNVLSGDDSEQTESQEKRGLSDQDVLNPRKTQENSVRKQRVENNGTWEPGMDRGEVEVPTPKGTEKCRMTEKQNVRGRLKGILLDVGWKIDLRPRNGRDYEDQVYISPPPLNRGYWSIVKAYDALLAEHGCKAENVEEQVLNGKVLPFPIVPLEEIALLKRIQVNKRVGKKRQEEKGKKGKGGRKHKREVKSEESRKGTKRRKVKENSVTAYDSDMDNSIGSSEKETLRAGKAKRVSGDKGRLVQGRRTEQQRGCALLVRGSNQNEDAGSDDYVLYDGKRTVLSWMIDLGVIPENGKVKYMNRRRTRVVHEGSITRDGIRCKCCSKIVTVPKFEVHAGSKLCQPYENIFVEGLELSLLQCQLDAWNKQEESERCGFYTIDTSGDDPNDDTCIICGDGGDLICCDTCPSTFHQSCLGIKALPSGDWHCPNCSCRFCGKAGSSYNGNCSTALPLISCGQCQEKFHQECIPEADGVPNDSCSLTLSFCGENCRKLFEQLQKLLGVRNPMEVGFLWTLIKRFDENSKESVPGNALRAECNSKLAVALTVMDECFLPTIDQRSGIDLIHNVLYNCGSNFNRLDYSGFYTLVLEREDEIISVATIRIHGTRLAEMPFIGTRNKYRRQGMCRRLLSAIESVLCSLNVEKLVIPAIPELFDTWTLMFGFKPLEEVHRQEMKSISMLVFPFTDMLHKPLLKKDLYEEKTASIEDGRTIEVESGAQLKPEMESNSVVLPLSVNNSHSSDKVCESHQPEVGIMVEGAILHDQKVFNHSGMETGPHIISVDSHLQTPRCSTLHHSYEVKIANDGVQTTNESGEANISGGKPVYNNDEHPDKVLEANPHAAAHLNSSEFLTSGPMSNCQSSEEGFHAVTVESAETELEYCASKEASGHHTSEAISDSSVLVASDSLPASHGDLEAAMVKNSGRSAIEDSSCQIDSPGVKDKVTSHSSVALVNDPRAGCPDELETTDGLNSGHYDNKTLSEKIDDTGVENEVLSHCHVAVGNEFHTICPDELNVAICEDSGCIVTENKSELINMPKVKDEVSVEDSGNNTFVTSRGTESSAVVSDRLNTYSSNEYTADGMHENKVLAAPAESVVDAAIVHVSTLDPSDKKAQVSPANSLCLAPPIETRVSSTVQNVQDCDGKVAHGISKLLDESKHTNCTSEIYSDDKPILTNGYVESSDRMVGIRLSGGDTDHWKTDNHGIALEQDSCTLVVNHVENHVESKSTAADAEHGIDGGEEVHDVPPEIEPVMINHDDSTHGCDEYVHDINGLKDDKVSMESDVCASVGDEVHGHGAIKQIVDIPCPSHEPISQASDMSTT